MVNVNQPKELQPRRLIYQRRLANTEAGNYVLLVKHDGGATLPTSKTVLQAQVTSPTETLSLTIEGARSPENDLVGHLLLEVSHTESAVVERLERGCRLT